MNGIFVRTCLPLILRTCLPFRSTRFFRTRSEHRRDSYEYTYLLHHCKNIKAVEKLHAQIIIGGYEQNAFLTTKLVGKYTGCNDSNMGSARKVFARMSDKDVFVWNVVIQGYANIGPFVEALILYDEMRFIGVSANCYTYPFVFKACGAMKGIEKGKSIHGQVIKSGFDLNLFVSNALVAFYSKCNEIEISRRVFDEIHQKDIVSWNSMISGYSTNRHVDEALALFLEMVYNPTSTAPDGATLVSVLPACVQSSAIQVGFWIHSYIIKSGIELDAYLGSCLISMYANCGRVNIAQNVFNQVRDKNIVVWSAMIRCYGMHGHADLALEMFTHIVELGLRPDSVIFLSLISTCSHAGLVEKGREVYKKMGDYGVERNEEHYACMVDLLGRAGLLEEAVEFIRNMPVEAGKDVYGALLGACRIYNNIELAEEVAEKLFVLDPDNAGRYIILAKMYEDVGKWEKAARVRKLLREKQIRKPVGRSSIEVDSIYHTFGVEDESHPIKERVFDTLETLGRMIDEEIKSFGLNDLAL